MLAFTLGPAEIAVLMLGVGAVALVIKILRTPRDTDVRRPCPECQVVNRVERAKLGKRNRCAACGSLLYPNEHQPAPSIKLENIGNVAQPSAPVERIIERQVVVHRCASCEQLTPIDAAVCQHCHAPVTPTRGAGARF